MGWTNVNQSSAAASSGLVPQLGLSKSGGLASAQQTIVIGGADTSGTLSGNTLKYIRIRMQLINALNALLTCTIKGNATAFTSPRAKWDGAAISSDGIAFRMFGGPAFTAYTGVTIELELRSGVIRNGWVDAVEMADNNTNSEVQRSNLWWPGNDRTTDITTITIDCGSAGGIKAGSSWQVWSLPDPA